MSSETPATASASRAAVAFIFITVFLDLLAIGLVIPVMPKLILEFLGNDTVRAAEILGVFGTVWALAQFFASPVQGSLSDSIGRRPVILGSNIGLGLDYILMALAPTLWWLFIGRIISGITAASISTAMAYVADVTAPEKRSAQMGLIGVAIGSGFVIGPAIGGLVGSIDVRLPFYLAAGLSLANALYGYFVLPESLPKERRTPFAWRAANPIGSWRLVRRTRELFGLAIVNFITHLAHTVLPAVGVIYMAYRYGFSDVKVGLTLAGVGVSSMIVQGLLIRVAVARLGERVTLVVGLLCGGAGFVLIGIAPNEIIYWLGLPLMGLWGLAGAATGGLMSQSVGPGEQGQLQGANMAAMGVAQMIGPLFFAYLFAFSIGPLAASSMSGFAFVVAGAMLFVSVFVGWNATRPVPRA